MKRSIIFIAVLILLATLGGGLGYFHFVVKPEMIKRFILQTPPPLASVAVAVAETETWVPRLPAIGTFRAVQEIDIAPQIGGAVVSVRVELGEDVEKGAPLFEIDNSVEQADLKNNLAVLKNADLALERQRQLISARQHGQGKFRFRRGRARFRRRRRRTGPRDHRPENAHRAVRWADRHS